MIIDEKRLVEQMDYEDVIKQIKKESEHFIFELEAGFDTGITRKNVICSAGAGNAMNMIIEIRDVIDNIEKNIIEAGKKAGLTKEQYMMDYELLKKLKSSKK